MLFAGALSPWERFVLPLSLGCFSMVSVAGRVTWRRGTIFGAGGGTQWLGYVSGGLVVYVSRTQGSGHDYGRVVDGRAVPVDWTPRGLAAAKGCAAGLVQT